MRNPDYTFGIASLEIIILLLVAFLLGMLLCSLLRTLGICCSGRDSDNSNHRVENASSDRGNGFGTNMHAVLRDNAGNSEPTSTTSALGLSAAAAGIGGVASHILQLGAGRKDDLKKLEGIGPKIEQILNAAGIQNFDQLAALTPEMIKPLLDNAGGQFKMHDPKSWPYQAELAAKGEWDRLREYQNLLIGGREDS